MQKPKDRFILSTTHKDSKLIKAVLLRSGKGTIAEKTFGCSCENYDCKDNMHCECDSECDIDKCKSEDPCRPHDTWPDYRPGGCDSVEHIERPDTPHLYPDRARVPCLSHSDYEDNCSPIENNGQHI